MSSTTRPPPLEFDVSTTAVEDGDTVEAWMDRQIQRRMDATSDLTFAVMVWGGGIVLDCQRNVYRQDYDLPMFEVRVIDVDGTERMLDTQPRDLP